MVVSSSFRTGQQETVVVLVGFLVISSLGLQIYYRIQGCLEFEKGTRQWWQQLGKLASLPCDEEPGGW